MIVDTQNPAFLFWQGETLLEGDVGPCQDIGREAIERADYKRRRTDTLLRTLTNDTTWL